MPFSFFADKKQQLHKSETQHLTASVTTLQAINNEQCPKAIKTSNFNGILHRCDTCTPHAISVQGLERSNQAFYHGKRLTKNENFSLQL